MVNKALLFILIVSSMTGVKAAGDEHTPDEGEVGESSFVVETDGEVGCSQEYGSV